MERDASKKRQKALQVKIDKAKEEIQSLAEIKPGCKPDESTSKRLDEIKKNYFLEGSSLPELATPIKGNSDNKEGELKTKGFYIENSCYVIEEGVKTKQTKRISNFIMEIIYFFPDGTNNAKRLIKLQNKQGDIELLEIQMNELTVSKFRSAVRSKGNYEFRGSEYELSQILEELFKDEKKAEEINALGFHQGNEFFAFSNGIIDNENFFKTTDEFGVVADKGKFFYIPANSFLNKYNSTFTHERNFYYEEGELNFEQWSRLILEAYGKNGATGIAYYIATLFRDIIFKELSFFPFLYLFGEYGSGKTSFVISFLSMFGKPQKAIGLQSSNTDKGFARRLSQFQNALIYLNEYKNGAKEIEGFLLSAYNGTGYERAQTTNNNRTHQTNVSCGLIIDGNELPEQKHALFSRMLLVSFKKEDFTENQMYAFNKLNDAQESGLCQITSEIFSHRKQIEKFLPKKIKEVKAIVSSEMKNSDERTIKQVSLILAPIYILDEILCFPFTKEEITKNVIEAGREQTALMKASGELSKFWKVIFFLQSEAKVSENIDFI